MKTARMLTIWIVAAVVMAWPGKFARAAEMGTAFTYQGHLYDANYPADGLYDFQFKLYDSDDPCDCNQIGADVNVGDMEVIDGYFTVALDFNDANAFNGDARWLEIGVRPGEQEDPNGYTALSPRQEVTAAPYVLHAKVAESTAAGGYAETDPTVLEGVKDGVDWSELMSIPEDISDGVVDWSELMGIPDDIADGVVDWSEVTSIPGGFADGVDDIGLTSETDPTVDANVKDGVDWSEVTSRPGGLDDGDDVGITVESDPEVGVVDGNYVPKWDGSALVTGTIYDDGNVGIGTTSPEAKLHIGGTPGVDGIKFPDGTVQTTSAAELSALIASLEARIAALENPPGWGFPLRGAQRIEADSVGDAVYPQVAVDSGGDAVAVWHQYDDTRWNIWSNRYVAGSGWGTAELIETDNSGSAEYPQVAVDSAGNAVAVWYQSDGTRDNIWSNRYVAGTGWGTAELIETDNASNANHPQVAVDSAGNAVAVWHQYDGTRWNIWSNRYVAGTGWGTAELIETENGSAEYPQVAVDSAGNAVAVWRQHDGSWDSIWSNRYVAGTGWGTAELIEENVGTADYPQVAVDSAGNAVAVWSQIFGTYRSIWSNRYVAGSGWGMAELIEENVGNAEYPQVAVDSAGNAVAVWYQSNGWLWNIWSSHYVE